MPNLIQIIKQAAVEAVEASKPTRVYYGTVVSTEPSIKIDQKFTIPKEFLILTNNVKDYEVPITITHDTETQDNHAHRIVIEHKTVTIHNGLKVGDKVILVQEQGGQKFIVLDKVGG